MTTTAFMDFHFFTYIFFSLPIHSQIRPISFTKHNTPNFNKEKRERKKKANNLILPILFPLRWPFRFILVFAVGRFASLCKNIALCAEQKGWCKLDRLDIRNIGRSTGYVERLTSIECHLHHILKIE